MKRTVHKTEGADWMRTNGKGKKGEERKRENSKGKWREKRGRERERTRATK